MANTTIIDATPEMAQQAVVCWNHAQNERYGRVLEVEPYERFSILAECYPGALTCVVDDSQVIGCVTAYAGRIGMLGVEPDRWGQGIGSKLLEYATRKLRDQGWPRGLLEVAQDNARAITLYERNDWKRIGPDYHYLDAEKTPMFMYQRLLAVLPQDYDKGE